MTLPKLVDFEDENITFQPSIDTRGGEISISIEGFGTVAIPNGPVVSICVENGCPVVRVWSDIQTEDATHVISLWHAREAERGAERVDA